MESTLQKPAVVAANTAPERLTAHLPLAERQQVR